MVDIEDAQLVIGHNIDFDMHIVGCELFRENMNYNKLMTKPSICTMQNYLVQHSLAFMMQCLM